MSNCWSGVNSMLDWRRASMTSFLTFFALAERVLKARPFPARSAASRVQRRRGHGRYSIPNNVLPTGRRSCFYIPEGGSAVGQRTEAPSRRVREEGRMGFLANIQLAEQV
jgi:hypothetical protein